MWGPNLQSLNHIHGNAKAKARWDSPAPQNGRKAPEIPVEQRAQFQKFSASAAVFHDDSGDICRMNTVKPKKFHRKAWEAVIP